MATRASVIFKEEGEPMFAMYKHWDGYPEGFGEKLKKIIAKGKLINGLEGEPKLGEVFNGVGCMFATIIAKLKSEPGDVYICHIDQVGNHGEDYIYEVNEKGEVSWKLI